MLEDKIKSDLQVEVKRQDPLILKTLRFMLSEINYAKIAKQAELTDEDVINVLTKEVKKRNEALELIKKGGREDLVIEELKKLEVIKKYLPPQMSKDDVEKIVDETLKGMTNPQIGPAIGEVMKKLKGKADGKMIAEMVRNKLTS